MGMLAGLILLLFTLFYYGVVRFNYPSVSQYPVRGIDVSHHQGKIDWQAVKKQDIQFAYIKSTEGVDYQDPMFKTNWLEAHKAGIIRGAYHFFNFCSSPVKQAENFIRVVQKKTIVCRP